ncbi:MAG: DsbA family protein [Candidatus Nitrosopumilus limneticus]|nr:Periplasmic thiol:disulfide interchange protein DsbA [Candidatus Nitrosopumilus limneticus]MDC4212459.1 DsbA family protein [Candidatus Nitrosopumilus limneticus]MDC4213205.1 DsbA family protein [Candidatus Nitrosopumilus limneticus]MDC4215817.1 DsbA family protein [Candidatus Nitrosopumilus limneticus]MDC4216734.1 DsbA family protein [Candidatus Nitrosopumilus limneticus]
MLHVPSLAIGAVIASITIVAVIFGINGSLDKQELLIEPTPKIDQIGPAKITMNTFVSNGSPILGNPNAPITLVEFGDYQCHYCNVFFQSIEGDIIKNYVETGKVKIIFKDYNIIGPDSINASHGAHCATEQGLFWEYHDILYSNWTGENNGWASTSNLTIFAQEINADMDMWTECMNKKTYSKTIMESNNDAKTLELTGTPAFFVINSNGEVSKLFGAQPFEVFQRVFDEQLQK